MELVRKADTFKQIISDYKTGTVTGIHPDAFNLYKDNYHKAIEGVFGTLSAGDKYFAIAEEFKLNTARLAAYKSSYLGELMGKSLNGDEKSFDQNSERLLKMFNQWQATEYNTAVARCRTAKQFMQFQERAEVFPNLEWLPSRSVNVREEHVKLYHVVRPIDDPLWQENQPGNLYNCKCDWQQTDKEPTGGDVKSVKPNAGLDGNPAKTYSIYSESHPYYHKVKDVAGVESFVKDYVWKQFVEIEKFSNGGAFYIHPFKLKTVDDFVDLNIIAKEWAKKGDVVYVMPDQAHKDGLYYKYLFNGAVKNKCPDLFKNTIFYEYESYKRPFNKDNSLSNMLTHGFRQSDKILIDIRETPLDIKTIREAIFERLRQKNKPKITEVWMFDGFTIQQVF